MGSRSRNGKIWLMLICQYNFNIEVAPWPFKLTGIGKEGQRICKTICSVLMRNGYLYPITSIGKIIGLFFYYFFKSPFYRYLLRNGFVSFVKIVPVAERVEHIIKAGRFSEIIESNSKNWREF